MNCRVLLRTSRVPNENLIILSLAMLEWRCRRLAGMHLPLIFCAHYRDLEAIAITISSPVETSHMLVLFHRMTLHGFWPVNRLNDTTHRVAVSASARVRCNSEDYLVTLCILAPTPSRVLRRRVADAAASRVISSPRRHKRYCQIKTPVKREAMFHIVDTLAAT